MGYTVDIEGLRDAYREAKQNPADEITFRWLRLNEWVNSTVAWIPDAVFMKGAGEIDMDSLEGRDCYAGLEKIDGIVASIMALDRAQRNEGQKTGSVYDERGLLVF